MMRRIRAERNLSTPETSCLLGRPYTQCVLLYDCVQFCFRSISSFLCWLGQSVTLKLSAENYHGSASEWRCRKDFEKSKQASNRSCKLLTMSLVRLTPRWLAITSSANVHVGFLQGWQGQQTRSAVMTLNKRIFHERDTRPNISCRTFISQPCIGSAVLQWHKWFDNRGNIDLRALVHWLTLLFLGFPSYTVIELR